MTSPRHSAAPGRREIIPGAATVVPISCAVEGGRWIRREAAPHHQIGLAFFDGFARSKDALSLVAAS